MGSKRNVLEMNGGNEDLRLNEVVENGEKDKIRSGK